MPQRSRLIAASFALMRYALLGAALSGVYIGAASSAFYTRQRRINAAQTVLLLPTEPSPVSATRLLVFAPHCDDETLGCAGLIQQTRRAGGSVHVAILTNGDAFVAAAEREFRRCHLQSADYLRFAALRQQESRTALQSLGVAPQDVQFFGYPDQGLMPMWNDYWNTNRQYSSPTLQCSTTPATLAAYPNAPYCGRELLENIKATLRTYRPTLVTVTHPAEDHADHAATSAFVALALHELQADSDPETARWAKQTQLRYYLVHRGDWPVPPSDTNRGLAPPAAMTGLDTLWYADPLTPEETARKAEAIALYPSQTAMMGPFLGAFARTNEIYGAQLPEQMTQIADNAKPLTKNAPVWDAISPALLSPLSDNIMREMQGGGDIKACRLCRDDRNLYVQIEARKSIGRRMAYTVHLRTIGREGASNGNGLTLRLAAQSLTLRDGTVTTLHDRFLTLAVPLRRLAQTADIHTLAFSAETSLAGVSIDQTGIRLMDW